MFAIIVRIAPRRPLVAGLFNLSWGTTNRRSGSDTAADAPALDLPEAVGAGDAELARLDPRRAAERQRDQCLVEAIYAGARSGL